MRTILSTVAVIVLVIVVVVLARSNVQINIATDHPQQCVENATCGDLSQSNVASMTGGENPTNNMQVTDPQQTRQPTVAENMQSFFSLLLTIGGFIVVCVVLFGVSRIRAIRQTASAAKGLYDASVK